MATHCKERIHLRFVVNLDGGVFEVSIHICEALKASAKAFLSSKVVRVHAQKLASLAGTVISMKEKKERNPLQEGMWRTPGPQRVYSPI